MSVRTEKPRWRKRPRMRNPSSGPGPRKPCKLVRFALSKDALKTHGNPASRAMGEIASAIRLTCSSLSITHGPAIRTNWETF